ncbi:unnamed protein product [Cunninghamella blakesleeana]
MIHIKQVLLLRPHQEFKRQSSLDTLIGEETEEKKTFLYNKKSEYTPTLRYHKKYPTIYQIKKMIQQIYQLNEQWQEARAIKRQKRKEKRPQDGKTNPFE